MTAITVPVRDRPLVRIGLNLLDKAIKQGMKSTAVLGLPEGPIQQLEAQSKALSELYYGSDHETPIQLPRHLVRTLRLGVAIEFDRVVGLKESQLALLVATSDTEERLRQLEGLLGLLDEQAGLFPRQA